MGNGIELGLENITAALARLGNPHLQLKCVHVAGTNGKGSVVNFVASALSTKFKIGSFTSPHFLDPNDAIKINNEPINQCIYQEFYDSISGFELSFFEREVIVCFLVFASLELDLCIIEVGMGGRLDATNVIIPLISCITNIGLDHVEFLGDTIEKIAFEKAGIIKPECKGVVLGIQDNHDKVLNVVRNKCIECNVPLVEACKATRTFNGYSISINDNESILVEKKMVGEYELENAGAAAQILHLLSNLGYNLDNPSLISDSFSNCKVQGRLTWTSYKSNRVLLDGCHNIQSLQKFNKYLSELKQENIVYVCGFSGNRDYKTMIKTVVGDSDIVFVVGFTKPAHMPWVQCMDPVEIAKQVSNCQYVGDLKQTLEHCSKSSNSLIVVCGSLYLIADFYRL